MVGGEGEGEGGGAIRGERVIIRVTLTASEAETESVAIDRWIKFNLMRMGYFGSSCIGLGNIADGCVICSSAYLLVHSTL